MIFVLNYNKEPLCPCNEAKARRLLTQGKAAIFKRYPFTIILKELKKYNNKQSYRLKIDYGSRHTGLAILNKSNIIWLAQIEHRKNIKKNIDDRRYFRKRRRNKNLRYRQPRFLNRKRDKGWIPPSLQSRVQNIKTWINRLMKLIPLTNISYEFCKFDTQKMNNPDISGIEYQQGVLKKCKIKEYLLKKYNYKCMYCGKTNVTLEKEHIIPKSRGGTNRIDNLGISCHKCNNLKGNMTAGEFGYPNIQQKVKQTLKDSSVVNATRWKIYNIIKDTGLSVECGTGVTTKMNRINLGLPKNHFFDACCIGQSTPEKLHLKINNVLYIFAKSRGKHSRTIINRYGFPWIYLTRQKYFNGFQSNDIIKANIQSGKYKGIWYGMVVCRKSGQFSVKNRNNMVILQSINYKYFRILQKFDGYNYKQEKIV